MLPKPVWLLGLALLGWAIIERDAFAEASLVISDGVRVELVPSATAWQLLLTEAGVTLSHDGLLPQRHPLSEHAVGAVSLRQEVNGLTVFATYPVHDFLLHYELAFQYQPPTAQRHCALQLQHYRSEQRYRATGKMRSGIAVDYSKGVAQPLALEGVSATTALHSIRLLAQDTCWLSLPAIYEFYPRLDVLRMH